MQSERDEQRVNVPGFIYQGLRALADRDGVSMPTMVAGILAAALGYERALVDGSYRLARADEAVRVEGALSLLARALAVPIRVDGIYQAAALAGLLEMRQSTLIKWDQEGWLRSYASPESGRRYYRGGEVLQFLMEQALVGVKAANAGRGAPRLANSESGPLPDAG